MECPDKAMWKHPAISRIVSLGISARYKASPNSTGAQMVWLQADSQRRQFVARWSWLLSGCSWSKDSSPWQSRGESTGERQSSASSRNRRGMVDTRLTVINMTSHDKSYAVSWPLFPCFCLQNPEIFQCLWCLNLQEAPPAEEQPLKKALCSTLKA